MEEFDHGRCVNTWIARVVNGTPGLRAIEAFEAAFAALWQRANLTLGEVTLSAIVNRVLCSAEHEFPFLSSLKLDGARLDCEQLRVNAPSIPREQLVDGIRFVLVELMTVVGNLTADILTPALHAELSSVSPESAQPSPGGRVAQ